MVLSAHDVSSGGLIITLSEMSIGSNIGLKIEKPKKLSNLIEYFFGEDQGRYVLQISKSNLGKVEKLLKKNSTFFEVIGATQKNYFEIVGEIKININELFKINNQWYKNY